LLKSIHKPTHLRSFAGQTLGVDAYGWLHRGTIACAIELAQQKPTRKHIEFTLNRVRMLIHFGVKPFLVFDGDYLPSKEHTEKERAARRKESQRMGLELLRMGRVSQAYLELQKAIDVTPLMARELIEELKRMDVPYIVAPYEADSQLAYLEKQGVISGIISEDSDLLVFGAKRLLTKLDQYGECVMISRADFTACREISLTGWTDREFRMMAMLSGCDYLPGIERMGLKTAYRLVRKHRTIDRIVRTVQFDGKIKVPLGYIEAFTRAERTFMYQWVFCPEAQGLITLNKVPDDLDLANMPYIGKFVPPDVAVAVASGDVDPNTKERLQLPGMIQLPAKRTKLAQTPNEKKGVPISEFFKPKRTPLAELDPNSFTPSPSQLRLLETQQTASWSALEVSTTRPQGLVRVLANSAPSSAPQPSKRSVSSPWPPAQKPLPKRQRLCSDNTLVASIDGSVGLETATSRFFSKQPAQPSPSARKAMDLKKKDIFDLWADNSTDEVVLAMATRLEEEHASSKKRKKLAVYADPPPGIFQSQEHTVDVSQGSASTTKTKNSSRFDSPGSSNTDCNSSTEGPVFNADLADLEKWAFRTNSVRPDLTQAKPISGTTQTDEVLGCEATLAKSTKLSRRYSGLEEFSQDSCGNDVLVPTSSPIQLATIPLDDIIEDEEWRAIERQRQNLGPLPELKGSEDLLVPDSPESASGEDNGRPRLDLGRFAFAG